MGQKKLASAILFIITIMTICCANVLRETSLRILLLYFGHTVIRVNQYDGVAISTISESSFITGNTLVSKSLEYLLEGRLRYAVLLNAEASLFML